MIRKVMSHLFFSEKPECTEYQWPCIHSCCEWHRREVINNCPEIMAMKGKEDLSLCTFKYSIHFCVHILIAMQNKIIKSSLFVIKDVLNHTSILNICCRPKIFITQFVQIRRDLVKSSWSRSMTFGVVWMHSCNASTQQADGRGPKLCWVT